MTRGCPTLLSRCGIGVVAEEEAKKAAAYYAADPQRLISRMRYTNATSKDSLLLALVANTLSCTAFLVWDETSSVALWTRHIRPLQDVAGSATYSSSSVQDRSLLLFLFCGLSCVESQSV